VTMCGDRDSPYRFKVGVQPESEVVKATLIWCTGREPVAARKTRTVGQAPTDAEPSFAHIAFVQTGVESGVYWQ